MLGQSLEETRFYQEVKAEGREIGREEEREAILRITVPLLLNTGMTLEQIAEHLKLDIQIVRQAAQPSA
jgi:predicted transposase YdaD